MNKKQIAVTRGIVIALIIGLAILLNSCTYSYNGEEVTCEDKIEYWESVLEAELYPGKRDNQKRICKIKIIIKEIKEQCQ